MNNNLPISKKDNKKNDVQTAVEVSVVSIAANTVLSVFKLVAGFLANSGAMVSDGVHSASDAFTVLVHKFFLRIIPFI